MPSKGGKSHKKQDYQSVPDEEDLPPSYENAEGVLELCHSDASGNYYETELVTMQPVSQQPPTTQRQPIQNQPAREPQPISCPQGTCDSHCPLCQTIGCFGECARVGALCAMDAILSPCYCCGLDCSSHHLGCEHCLYGQKQTPGRPGYTNLCLDCCCNTG